MNPDDVSITITFGEVSTTHVGMEVSGDKCAEGYTKKDLINISEYFDEDSTELIKLKYENEKGYILVVRNAVDQLLNQDNSDECLFGEHLKLQDKYDRKVFMRGAVKNKRARYNLCFGDEDQDPDYENKKGTIVSWEHIPLTYTVKKRLDKINKKIGSGKTDLVAESNIYFNDKCGIGYHGDRERSLVIGMRLGRDQGLTFRWFLKSKPVSEEINIKLKSGDIYFMEHKATGYDWLKKNIPTLRHAAGHESYLKTK